MAHQTPIVVRFADLDKFNHVNNAVYLTYAEQARIKYFDDTLGSSIDWKAKGLILAKSEANYIRPIMLHDDIYVETCCDKIGTKSIRLVYRIFKNENGTTTEMCNGITILVGYDYNQDSSIPIPKEWKKKLIEN